jgi:hypothetical protein
MNTREQIALYFCCCSSADAVVARKFLKSAHGVHDGPDERREAAWLDIQSFGHRANGVRSNVSCLSIDCEIVLPWRRNLADLHGLDIRDY